MPSYLQDEEDSSRTGAGELSTHKKKPITASDSKDNSFDLDADQDQSEAKIMHTKLNELNFNEHRLVKRGSLPAIKLCGGGVDGGSSGGSSSSIKPPPLEKLKPQQSEKGGNVPSSGHASLTTKQSGGENRHNASGMTSSESARHATPKCGTSPTSVSGVKIKLATNCPTGNKK